MASPRDELVRVVRDVVVPLIEADGGEVFLVSAEDAGITLHLGGRFSGCPGNTLVRRRVLEPLLASVVPGAYLSVTTGPLVPPGADRLGTPRD